VGVGLGALALARHGLTQQGLLAAGLLPVLAVLAGIDLRCRLLPNRIVLPALGAVIVWQIGFAPQRTGEWLGAAVGAALFLAVPSLLRPGAVGMGDVKLAALLGAALGAEVAGALLIGLVAMAPVALIVLWRGGRQATLPMGPCLAFGAAVLLLACGRAQAASKTPSLAMPWLWAKLAAASRLRTPSLR
jgi:leader peptidase (prepilin peptidase)/N-methyltransferase